VSADNLQRLSSRLDVTMICRAVGDIDVDAALDARDENTFENAWNSSYDAQCQSRSRLHDIELAQMTSICERAYKLAFKATEHPELSGCVSDDFDLIATALLCDLEDAFAAHLLNEYVEGRFPIGVPTVLDKSLTAVLGRQDGG
jgi:hypothetical protein